MKQIKRQNSKICLSVLKYSPILYSDRINAKIGAAVKATSADKDEYFVKKKVRIQITIQDVPIIGFKAIITPRLVATALPPHP